MNPETTPVTIADHEPMPPARNPDAPVVTKPGWRTTEFWLALAATLLSALYASGTLKDAAVRALVAKP